MKDCRKENEFGIILFNSWKLHLMESFGSFPFNA